jgi:hypothetical protein
MILDAALSSAPTSQRLSEASADAAVFALEVEASCLDCSCAACCEGLVRADRRIPFRADHVSVSVSSTKIR